MAVGASTASTLAESGCSGAKSAQCPQCKVGELQLLRPGLVARWRSRQVCQICSKRISRSEARWRCTCKCSFTSCSSCMGYASPTERALSSSSISSSISIKSTGPKRKNGGRIACKYGAQCFQSSSEHLATYAHPGDRDYRQGRTVFEEGQEPELETLWQIFTFFDPQESGHLSQSMFSQAAAKVGWMVNRSVDAGAAWVDAGGDNHGNVSFPRFCYWASRTGLDQAPVGLDPGSGGADVCKMVQSDGSACSCQSFQPVSVFRHATGAICACGHRMSAHRTEAAGRSLGAQLSYCRPPHWQRATTGLVEVKHPSVLAQFQFLLDVTHKETDNWTRDRGCAIHGINGCQHACAYRNRQPVPSGYRLVSLRRNQSPRLWFRYSLMRASVLQECTLGDFKAEIVESTQPAFDELDSAPLVDGVNEWRLFHGSTSGACEEICENNFNLALAGTGATWKHASGANGTPLYGQGVYFSERITKADEYAKPHGVDNSSSPSNFCSVLVCRVIAGRVAVCTKNEIDTQALRQQVLGGPFHCILGDRVKELGKPYREMVIYDRDQIYPEYLLTYERLF